MRKADTIHNSKKKEGMQKFERASEGQSTVASLFVYHLSNKGPFTLAVFFSEVGHSCLKPLHNTATISLQRCNMTDGLNSI